MGANPTQAQGAALFFAAFVVISAGLAADVSYVLVLLGIALLVTAIALFRRCKPWEQTEE